MSKKEEKEVRYRKILSEYDRIIRRICFVYADASNYYDDLYQEVCINLWMNLDTFKGKSKFSTWLYRLALNTCLTQLRKTPREEKIGIDAVPEMPDDSNNFTPSEINELYLMISRLNPMEKSIVLLWLDENSYEEISLITGLSKANVAIKLHRIKDKLNKMSNG